MYIIIIIIIKTFKVLIKERKGEQKGMSAGIFQNWKIAHPVDRTFEKNEKKGCRFKRKGGVFMPPFASFVDQTK